MYQLHSIASGRQKHVALDLLMGCSDLYLTDAFPDFLYLSLLTFKPKAQSNRPKKGSTCMSAHAAELSLPIPSFSLMVGLVRGDRPQPSGFWAHHDLNICFVPLGTPSLASGQIMQIHHLSLRHTLKKEMEVS